MEVNSEEDPRVRGEKDSLEKIPGADDEENYGTVVASAPTGREWKDQEMKTDGGTSAFNASSGESPVEAVSPAVNRDEYQWNNLREDLYQSLEKGRLENSFNVAHVIEALREREINKSKPSRTPLPAIDFEDPEWSSYSRIQDMLSIVAQRTDWLEGAYLRRKFGETELQEDYREKADADLGLAAWYEVEEEFLPENGYSDGPMGI